MNHEHLDILMNRAVDGKATAPEREELARALLADPTLRSEYDELMGAHISTVALFERLELPEDFSSRVMRRVQPDHVPTDADLTAIIEESDMPEPLPSPALASGKTATWQRQAKITTILSTVGALSAAAALLLAIGLLTGIIGSNKPQQQPDAPVSGRPGVPVERKGPAPTPAPKSEPGTPGEAKKEPGVPDSPKSEPKQPENPAPKGEEEEDKKTKIPDEIQPKDPERKSEKGKDPEGKVDGSESPKSPEKPNPENSKPGPDVPEKKEEVGPGPSKGTEQPEKPDTQPGPTPQPPVVWGRLLCVPKGDVKFLDENGKLITLDADTDVRVGMKFSTTASCVAVLTWQGGGYFSAGGSTVFGLAQSGFTFEDGEIAVDYDGGKNPPYVSFGAYSLCVKSGTVLVEHKTSKKVAISQSSGESLLKFGDLTLVIEAGCQVDVDFGKMPTAPKAKPFMLPTWCAEARREINLYRIDSRLTERKATRTQTTSLQAQVTRLSKLPHTTAYLVFLMNHVLELECLSVSDLTNMLKEVEKAYMAPDNKEMLLDDTIKLACECTWEIKNYAEWLKRFGNRVKEFSRKDMKEKEAKEKEARKMEEEKRAREQGGKDAVKGDKMEKKEENRDGKEAIPDKPKNEEEHKKEAPKKD